MKLYSGNTMKKKKHDMLGNPQTNVMVLMQLVPHQVPEEQQIQKHGF